MIGLWNGMAIGLGGNVLATGGGGGGALWTPASASVPLVSQWDPSDITKLFQDNAATTAVTADGQHVGNMKDPTSGFDVTTVGGTVSTVGPIYHPGSGKPFLQFTTTGGEYLATPVTHQFVNATDGTHTIGLAWVPTDVTGTQLLVKTGTAPKGLVLNSGVTEFSALRADSFTAHDPGATLTVGTSYSLIGVATANTVEIFVNGVSAGSTSIGAATFSTAAFGLTFSDGTAAGKLYFGGIWSGAFNSADRAALDTFQLAKMP
jgi:hypothetical protein